MELNKILSSLSSLFHFWLAFTILYIFIYVAINKKWPNFTNAIELYWKRICFILLILSLVADAYIWSTKFILIDKFHLSMWDPLYFLMIQFKFGDLLAMFLLLLPVVSFFFIWFNTWGSFMFILYILFLFDMMNYKYGEFWLIVALVLGVISAIAYLIIFIPNFLVDFMGYLRNKDFLGYRYQHRVLQRKLRTAKGYTEIRKSGNGDYTTEYIGGFGTKKDKKAIKKEHRELEHQGIPPHPFRGRGLLAPFWLSRGAQRAWL